MLTWLDNRLSFEISTSLHYYLAFAYHNAIDQFSTDLQSLLIPSSPPPCPCTSQLTRFSKQKGISMGPKAGTFVLLLLGLTLLSDARSFLPSTISEEVTKNENVCTLCEEYVNSALSYLEKNETQTQILEDLHDQCSHIRGFEQQCLSLVDYYLPLFFLHIESFQPHYFCKRMNLCGHVVAFVEEARQDTCDVCHRTVSEILIKLQDPDTQLDIVELLLKGCKSFKNLDYEKKCKKLVFEYGPLILVNAEEFLVKNDICTLLRACPNEKTVLKQAGLADS